MIDRAVFAQTMGVFADRIGRALAPATSEAYYETLSELLDTREFVAGARIVFRAHTYNTWPAPQLFIDAVKPTARATLGAAEAFEKVLDIMGDSRKQPWERREEVAQLGTIAARAFRAAGGLREFVDMPLDKVTWAKKEFVACYELALSEEAQQTGAEHALAQGDTDPSVSALVASVTAALPDVNKRGLPKGNATECVTSSATPITRLWPSS